MGSCEQGVPANYPYHQARHHRSHSKVTLLLYNHPLTLLFCTMFRKERCEKELAQIEKDLEKLNKDYIFVDTTA